MSAADDVAGEPEPESADLSALAARLEQERSRPAPAYRGDLRRHLLSLRAARPANLERRVVGLASAGAGLFALAAAGLGGLGPLAG